VLLGDDERALTAGNSVTGNALNGDHLNEACDRFGTFCSSNN
jgi:hypothetical protein